MRNVTVKAVRSDGRSFSYTNADWGILSNGLTGIDFPTIEIYKSNRGFGNGAIITGKRKEAREIGIIAVSRNATNNEADRILAIAFHNSNYTYDLYITYMGKTRIAKACELQGAKCPSENVYNKLELTVSFLVPESDLFADNTEETQFKDTDALWHVTRAYAAGGGTLAFGLITHTTTKYIEYLGSEFAPVTVTVEANGFVDGMNVAIGDVAISIDCELHSGDILILNSESRIITINGVKMSESLYNSNDLPELLMKYGDNKVRIEADDPGNTAFDADLKFTGRYGGL